MWESGAMRTLVGLGMTLGYALTLLATAARRPFRAPARPSWSIGDEARAVYLRRFWRSMSALPLRGAAGRLTLFQSSSRAGCCARGAAATRSPACR